MELNLNLTISKDLLNEMENVNLTSCDLDYYNYDSKVEKIKNTLFLLNKKF